MITPIRAVLYLREGWISRKPAVEMSTLAAIDGAIEALARTMAGVGAGPGERDHSWSNRYAALAIASLRDGGPGSFRSRRQNPSSGARRNRR